MPLPAAAAPVNLYEAAGQLSVAVPVPGAHAEHTRVVVEPRRVVIDAECKYPQEQQQYLRRDWQVGAWRVAVDTGEVHVAGSGNGSGAGQLVGEPLSTADRLRALAPPNAVLVSCIEGRGTRRSRDG